MNVNANDIIKVSAGANGLIASLYSNSILQIRRLSNLDELLIKFPKINYSTGTGHPKISW